jgi:hypothetical protein
MQTMQDRLAGNGMREITDVALTVVTLLALVGMFGYYKISDMLSSIDKEELMHRSLSLIAGKLIAAPSATLSDGGPPCDNKHFSGSSAQPMYLSARCLS